MQLALFSITAMSVSLILFPRSKYCIFDAHCKLAVIRVPLEDARHKSSAGLQTQDWPELVCEPRRIEAQNTEMVRRSSGGTEPGIWGGHPPRSPLCYTSLNFEVVVDDVDVVVVVRLYKEKP